MATDILQLIFLNVNEEKIGRNINKMADIRKFIVDEQNVGIRVDKFLSVQMPEFSRSEIQKFSIKRANGDTVKLSEKTNTPINLYQCRMYCYVLLKKNRYLYQITIKYIPK